MKNCKHKIIYPGVIASKTNVGLKETYFILEELSNEQILKQVLLYLCPFCKTIAEEEYDTINNLPDIFFCKQCKKTTTNILEHTIIAYKKSP